MIKEFNQLKFINTIFKFLIIIFLVSCENESDPTKECIYENLKGKYLFYSETDTSSQNIEIDYFEPNKFETRGISGYGFWFPSAPLSGEINNCQIILDSYKNIERQGLPSPGGNPRKYYESMSGFGKYFSENDSIKLFITYERTGDFPHYFSGEIYLIKLE